MINGYNLSIFYTQRLIFFAVLCQTVNLIETPHWSLFYHSDFIGLKINKAYSFQNIFNISSQPPNAFFSKSTILLNE